MALEKLSGLLPAKAKSALVSGAVSFVLDSLGRVVADIERGKSWEECVQNTHPFFRAFLLSEKGRMIPLVLPYLVELGFIDTREILSRFETNRE